MSSVVLRWFDLFLIYFARRHFNASYMVDTACTRSLRHSCQDNSEKKWRSSFNVKLASVSSFVSVTPLVCAVIWHKVGKLRPKNSLRKYLLWEFLLLKTYVNEYALCALTGKSGKTFQRWNWLLFSLSPTWICYISIVFCFISSNFSC